MTSKKDKKESSPRVTPAESSTPQSTTAGDGSLPWLNLLIGFRGDGGLIPAERTENIKSSRSAIEEAFTEVALARWTSGVWKSDRVDGGGESLEGLAAFVSAELNAGRKPSCKLRFHVFAERTLARVTGEIESAGPPKSSIADELLRQAKQRGADRKRGRGGSLEAGAEAAGVDSTAPEGAPGETPMAAGDNDPVPEVKPDGTLCWWKSKQEWIDDVAFQILVEPETGESVAGDAPGVTAGSLEPWRPDGRHEMLARLVFDCPYGGDIPLT